MNKLRENTGVILWILVISFGVIWTLQDSDVFNTVGQPTGNIAVVNGADISYQEFQQAVEQQMQRVRQQMGGDVTPQMQDMVREQTYTQLVNAQLIEQEMDRLGIQVTDAEVMDMVYGEDPHPTIRQQFADDSGEVDQQLIANLAQNPEMRESWLQLENFLREERRQNKMNTLLESTVHVSNQDVEEAYFRQNARANVQYVALNYASVSSDEIDVSESDLRDYYDENREDFRRERTYEVEYAALPKEPTSEDSSAVLQDLENLQADFEEADDVESFLDRNGSVVPYNDEFVDASSLPDAVADAVFEDPTSGRVTDIIVADGNAQLVRIMDTQPVEDAEEDEPEVEVKLAIMALEIRPSLATIREIEDRMDDIAFYAEEGDFEEEAQNQDVEVERLTAQDGDETFPEIGQSRALRDFLSAAEPGEISDVLELEDRFVVARLSSIEEEGYRSFSDVQDQIEPRVVQDQRQEVQVQRMQDAYQGAESLDDLADALGVRLRTQEDISYNDDVIPGLGRDPMFVGTVFGLDADERSGVVGGANAAYVVEVTDWDEPEPITDAEREELRQQLLTQRQQQVVNQWIESLREDATIDDNRAAYF
ncbi:MAG: SurA N-terminal domain-containing protein [Longimonas sp.]|uniref:peptidylprolyl isomerase n=1 Tax=Longimonas sp. TaxID=2039626 RepID=UPI00397474B5